MMTRAAALAARLGKDIRHRDNPFLKVLSREDATSRRGRDACRLARRRRSGA